MVKEIITDVERDKSLRINKKLKLTLGLPVSVNSMYWGNGRGKRLTSKAKKYELESRAMINQFMEEQSWVMIKDKTWLYVDCVFYFPDRRIRDASNLLKLLLDVMQGYVYKNDYIALPRIQSVEYDKENPRVELTISVQTSIQREKGLKMVSL